MCHTDVFCESRGGAMEMERAVVIARRTRKL
jgi:hypothetical protein